MKVNSEAGKHDLGFLWHSKMKLNFEVVIDIDEQWIFDQRCVFVPLVSHLFDCVVVMALGFYQCLLIALIVVFRVIVFYAFRVSLCIFL